ncbi:hypothetical protein GCM10023321_73220 [Pseudonocardia eucalypti]|uniref:Uncharacterized protein n=1 Tax=Pseudonocardia eucalypti TaxID=648755 RepID=A0ABP9R8T3_9PSEU
MPVVALAGVFGPGQVEDPFVPQERDPPGGEGGVAGDQPVDQHHDPPGHQDDRAAGVVPAEADQLAVQRFLAGDAHQVVEVGVGPARHRYRRQVGELVLAVQRLGVA